MKTTARTLAGLIALACSLAAASSHGGTWPGGFESLHGSMTLGQMGPTSQNVRNPRAEVDDLLARGRQAMQEGNLKVAELLFRQAEGYGVKYPLFYNGDTPQKALRDLEAMRRRPGGSSGSGGLLAGLGGSPAPAEDPFAGLYARSQPRDLFRQDPKSRAQSFLAKGREELAQNNVVAATQWYRKALQEGATFGPHEDSPEKLAADIRRRHGQGDDPAPGYAGRSSAITPLPALNQVNPIPPAPTHARRVIDDPATAYQTSSMPRGLETAPPARSYRSTAESPYQAQSDELLRNARRALSYRDINRASELIAQAKRLRVPYGAHEDSPAKVEATMRRLQKLSARRPGTETYRQEYAEFLMEQSQALRGWGEYDEAERLAHEAARQQVAYRPGEVRPQDLLEQIRLDRRSDPSILARRRTVDVRVPGPAPSAAAKQRAEELVSRSLLMLKAGDLRGAEQYAREAQRMQIPDSAWGPQEFRPDFVLREIEMARRRAAGGVLPAGAESIGTMDRGGHAAQAIYHPATDRTRNEWAGAFGPPEAGYGQVQHAQHMPTPAPPREYAPPGGEAQALNPGMALYEQGKRALEAHDLEKALDYFRRANRYRDQLDAITARQLRDKLQLLSANRLPQQSDAPPEPIPPAGTPMSAPQVYAQITAELNNAMRYLQSDPKRCQAMLEEHGRRIEALNIDPNTKGQLVRRVNRQLDQVRRYIQDNLARIEQEESNQRVREEVDREQRVKLEIQQKLALMVEEYNRFLHEQRFHEAELLARKAAELDPDNPVVQQLLIESKIRKRYHSNLALADEKERGTWEMLDSVEQSSVPFDDFDPYQFGDLQRWADITRIRRRWLEETGRQRSDRELEIEQKLQTPVQLEFTDAPLSQVMDHLARLAQINLYLDPHGLAEEGVMTDTPVTINLPQEISLKSALELILQPLNLSYVIKHEVLKVTSVHLRDNETFTVTYPVADLVIPIPNFVPNPNMGMAGALRNALGDLGYAGMGVGGVSPMAVALATKDGSSGSGMVNPNLMAQMTAGGPAMGSGGIMPLGFGPGGLGGAAAADFDSLEALITRTVKPDTWQDMGGPGTIDHLETNLSLVIRQTQEVHQEIVELLEQLRRMQDLQVTIEVRFITLNDNFYERIGVDFDFDIDDNIDRPFQVFGRTIDDGDPATGTEPTRNTLDTDHDNGSVSVGMSAPGIFSADLDVPFSQNSFGLAIPQFGGYDPSASATIGFAILSDIEAFFFIEAAQGDRRSNILQAPKVTLFNGQQAFVSDTSQSPFVISVIPVVGDFAAAQQPVIVVLSEGTFLTVQAVVSPDRRYVRLTVVPFFSEIGEVETFQFEGSETTTTDTSREGIQDEPNDSTKSSDSTTITRSGTTVQLPTFSFITVTTTVSVPDGGTVLLGGIKRLSEGRNEFGVPMLNKIPYLNRLFKNVGIGRETQSLMMTVTPRIIIQEEEEENMGIFVP